MKSAVKSEEISPQKEYGRPKSTLNIFRNGAKQNAKISEEKTSLNRDPDKPILLEGLKSAWREFAEQRKNQIAEYQLLQRDYVLSDAVITLQLSNAIEEPLLQNIRGQLTAFLRHKLGNNSIAVMGVLELTSSKKVIYTNKEKFDHLAEKNPTLNDLKERLGLDTDF